MKIGHLTLDVGGRTLIGGDGQDVSLRRMEFDLLLAFARSPGRVLSRDFLLGAIAGRGSDPFDRTVDVLVARLRKKIEVDPKAPRLILTVPGTGYKLTVKPLPVGTEFDTVAEVTLQSPVQSWPVAAERRQMTILMCALIEATALSARLDPEELAAVVAGYHRCCADIVVGCTGVVAKFQGATVTAYFGYPEANEHQAERAIRAALGIVEAVAKLDTGLTSSVHAHIGVATGTVLVGELFGVGATRQHDVLGEAPNIAARLLSLASPNGVLVSASTMRLVGGLFEFRELAPIAVEGSAQTIRAFAALGEAGTEGRFEALHGLAIAPLVGREEELSLLRRRWQQAKGGAGKIVLLSGEPGMGKSRLVHELRTALAEETQSAASFFCSPHHGDRAYHPFIGYLQNASGFDRFDGPEQRSAKLANLLRATGATSEATALLADLLAVPTTSPGATSNLSLGQRRVRTLQSLIGQVGALAERGPLLVLFEDVQWIDPSSREVLDALVDRIVRLPALLLMTFRPEFFPPWTGRPQATTIALHGLNDSETAEMVEHLARGDPPAGLCRRIAERSDGVPLFIEELTKAALAGGGLSLPASLHDALMAQLDRLPAAKKAMQIGAAIGRSFPHELVATVAGQPEAALSQALDQFVASGLGFRRGAPPEATYVFKHALVQDAAYESLPVAQRRPLHGAIAAALEAQFPCLAETEPALLAHHFARGGEADRASVHHERAGDQAVTQSAYPEAIASYRQALEQVAQLPEGAAPMQRELALLLKVGPALMVAHGVKATEVGTVYGRARALTGSVGTPHDVFKAMWGQWINESYRDQASIRKGEELSVELLALAEGIGDEDLVFEALHCRFGTAPGNVDVMLARTGEALARYQPERHMRLTASFGGHDAAVCAHSLRALAFATSGQLAQARSAAAASIDLAERLKHPSSLVWGLLQSASALHFAGDRIGCAALAGRIAALAQEHGFLAARRQALWLSAWACADGPEFAENLAALEAGRPDEMVPGGIFYWSNMAVLAELQCQAGRPAAALERLDAVTASLPYPAAVIGGPELYRIRAEALLGCNPPVVVEAEQSLRTAVEAARKQGASLLELRAAVALARLLAAELRRSDALAVLAPVLSAFNGDVDATELREARMVLQRLYAESP